MRIPELVALICALVFEAFKIGTVLHTSNIVPSLAGQLPTTRKPHPGFHLPLSLDSTVLSPEQGFFKAAQYSVTRKFLIPNHSL